MQDKEFQNQLNKEFEEFAWQEMRKVLDKEMPVQKKKRRAFFWLWFGGFGLIFLIALGFSTGFFNQRNEPHTDPVESDLPLVKEETAVNSTVANNTKENDLGLSGKQKDSISNNNQIQAENQKKDKLQQKNSLAGQSLKILPAKPNDHSDNSTKGAPENKTIGHEQRVFSLPESISQIPLSRLVLDPKAMEFPALVTEALEKPLSTGFKWGLMSGIKTEQFPLQNTFVVGLLGEFRLGPKWYLQAGLGYGYKISNEGSLSDAENLDASADQVNNDTMSAGPGATNPDQEQETFNQINALNVLSADGRFHLLYLPLQLGYKFHPKFSVSGGLELSYVLNGNTNKVQGGFGRSSFLDANQNQVFQSAVAERFIKRWDLMGSTGIFFHPNEKMDLGLQYQHLLFKPASTAEPKQSLLGNNLKLSFHYFFR